MPTYINGVFISEHVFKDGGTILKFSLSEDSIDALAAQLKSNASGGYVNLKIQRLREPSLSKRTGKVVSTHSLSVDEWKPKEGGQQASRTPPAAKPLTPEEIDDVPF